MKPNVGALMVTDALTMQEWTRPKEILLSQKYISTLRQSKASTKNSKHVFFKMNSSLGSFLLHYNGGLKTVSTIGCDQQINKRDYGLFSIAYATELAFKGDPVMEGIFHGQPVLSGVYCVAVFVWTRQIGLVFLLSTFSANALTKLEAKHIVPAHGALLVSLKNTVERSDLSNNVYRNQADQLILVDVKSDFIET